MNCVPKALISCDIEMVKKSKVSVRPLTIWGSKTTPMVPIFAFSGCSCGLPPTTELIWATVTPLFAAFGPPADPGAAVQRAARAVSPGVSAHGSFDDSKLPPVCPRNSSRMFGARKAVEYVPRKVTSRIGLQRAPSLYVQSDPNVL